MPKKIGNNDIKKYIYQTKDQTYKMCLSSSQLGMVPAVSLSELEKILQYYLGLPDDKSAKYFTYSDYYMFVSQH